MAARPSSASVRNQASIAGPNNLPMRAVPCAWKRNRQSRMSSVSGTTSQSREGRLTVRPSTALSTEIAGVMAPSAKNSAAPSRPMLPMMTRPRATRPPSTSVASASTPPSPRLSAVSTTATYLMQTTMISAQTTSDRAPSTFSGWAMTGEMASAVRKA